MAMIIHRWRMPEPSNMKKNFDFVNVTAPSDKSKPEYRRQVHVQAMKSFRRKQRLANVEAYERAKEQETAKEEDSEEDLAKSIVLDWSSNVSAASVDPFHALPPGFEDHQDLLRFFQTRIGPMLLPDDAHFPGTSWSTQWLNFAVQSPLMLAATCSHAAVFLDDVQGKPLSARSFELQSRTMRSLNQSLEDGVSDEAIGVVLMLFANTIITGSTEEMNMHMLALDRMVGMRGGRESIGGDSSMQMGVLWHLGAFYAFINPQLPSSILEIPRVPAIDTNHQLSTLLSKCRDLTRTRRGLESARDVDKLRIRQFSDQRSVLECQLGRLRHELQDHPRAETDPSLMLHRAMCLAALFYCFFYLRRFLMGGRFTDNMIYELVDTLTQTEDYLFAADSKTTLKQREAALWAAAIASRFAQTGAQLDFTRKCAMRLARSLELTSKDEVIRRLGHFAWPDDSSWDSTLVDLIANHPS